MAWSTLPEKRSKQRSTTSGLASCIDAMPGNPRLEVFDRNAIRNLEKYAGGLTGAVRSLKLNWMLGPGKFHSQVRAWTSEYVAALRPVLDRWPSSPQVPVSREGWRC